MIKRPKSINIIERWFNDFLAAWPVLCTFEYTVLYVEPSKIEVLRTSKMVRQTDHKSQSSKFLSFSCSLSVDAWSPLPHVSHRPSSIVPCSKICFDQVVLMKICNRAEDVRTTNGQKFSEFGLLRRNIKLATLASEGICMNDCRKRIMNMI